jgi:hypothetical protein
MIRLCGDYRVVKLCGLRQLPAAVQRHRPTELVREEVWIGT